MQGKVSMVMPCYNKIKYIGDMFDSIIAQDWDNIELILVNDGSTDGTREVIANYEPKFRARGFEAVIIDQENAGVCAAAKAGLERITGDYICMVDADDELDPKYVSTMAGWLEENPEYDLAACEGINYTASEAKKVFTPFNPKKIFDSDTYLAERYLLGEIRTTVWIYMVRAKYLYKCCILETYYISTKGSHEPGYIIPLLSFGGKLKFFPLPLYHFNVSDEGHSRSRRYEQMQKFYDEYDQLCKIAIDLLPDAIADKEKKQRLKDISIVSKYISLFRVANSLSDGAEHVDLVLSKLLDVVNLFFCPNPKVLLEQVQSPMVLSAAIKNNILGIQAKSFKSSGGRIIAWGVLGKNGKNLLPFLKGTLLEPMEFWDAAGDGLKVMKPDLDSLTTNDMVLIFPSDMEVVENMLGSLRKTKCNNAIIYRDILSYTASVMFPMFYDGNAELIGKGE